MSERIMTNKELQEEIEALYAFIRELLKRTSHLAEE
jgi:hypothetical protein